ncbi:MAG TPA: hypothetical protein P5186_21280 [Candidatus Paceibacterota bacterium]|nr:hypothetical protein [Candidatus Paceibacterota bacterium]
MGAQHYGAERQESGAAKAERLVREELAELGWEASDLAQRRKGDPGKVRIARRLWQETTMTLGWIARRLNNGCVDARIESAPFGEAVWKKAQC